MKEEIILICSSENTGCTAGRWNKCSNCKNDVWVSDSSINALKGQQPDKILCFDCGMVKYRNENELNILPLTAEQIREIKNGLKKSKRNSN